MVVRAFVAALALAILPIDAPARAQSGQIVESSSEVAPETILLLEQEMVMPPNAGTLEGYTRYYAAGKFADEPSRDREVVIGVLVRRLEPLDPSRSTASPVAGVEGAFIVPGVDSLPVIYDGGCSVITVYFDRATEKFFLPWAEEGAGPYGGAVRAALASGASGLCNGVA